MFLFFYFYSEHVTFLELSFLSPRTLNTWYLKLVDFSPQEHYLETTCLQLNLHISIVAKRNHTG